LLHYKEIYYFYYCCPPVSALSVSPPVVPRSSRVVSPSSRVVSTISGESKIRGGERGLGERTRPSEVLLLFGLLPSSSHSSDSPSVDSSCSNSPSTGLNGCFF